MDGKSFRKSKFLVNTGEKLKELSRKPNFLFKLGISIVILLLVLPYFAFIFNLFRQSDHFSLDGFKDAFGTRASYHLIFQTLILAFGSAFFALFLGLTLGFFFTATRFPLRRLFLAFLIFPLCIPSYLWALGWELILGRQGYLQELLWENAGDLTASFLFSNLGAIFVFGLYYSGLVILSVILFLSLKRYNFLPNPDQTWRKNFLGFVGSYLKSSIFWFSSFLVLVMVFRDFGGNSLLGRETLSTEIFSFFSTFYNYDSIVSPGIIILIFSLVFWAAWEWMLKRHVLNLMDSERRKEVAVLGAEKWQTPLFWTSMFFVTAFYFFPVWIFFVKSGGMRFYWDALREGGGSVLRTIIFSLLGSFLLVSLVLGIDRFLRVVNKLYASAVEKVFAFIFFIPGILTGVLLNRFWNHSWSAWIYTTYVIVFLGVMTQYLYPLWYGKRLFDSSDSDENLVHKKSPAHHPLSFFKGIQFLLQDVRVLGLAMFGLIIFLREMGSSVLLYPPGKEPLLVKIFTLKPVESEPITSGLAVIYLILVSIPIIILAFRFRKI